VISVGLLKLHVFQTEFTDPQLGLLPVLLRVRRKVPGVYLVPANVNLVYVLHLRYLLNQSFHQSINQQNNPNCRSEQLQS